MPLTADDVIRMLGLVPHPAEGGYFARPTGSTVSLRAAPLPQHRHLLPPRRDSFSACTASGATRSTTSTWANPVEMLLLRPDGAAERVTIGTDIAAAGARS